MQDKKTIHLQKQLGSLYPLLGVVNNDVDWLMIIRAIIIIFFFTIPLISAPIDTVKILGIMVEFKSDNDDRTTGDGKFIMSGSSLQIDPPPHDSLYFYNKIRFVKNYFKKVSNNKLHIVGDIIGQKITLTKTMLDYSPPITGKDNSRLIQLASDSWKTADTLFTQINFSDYDLFVVFHAGVGRDIDMVEMLGYNPTPYDLPSLYLNLTSLASEIDVSGGYKIKNTIILPETETRNINGSLLQLSINGMFAACIGNYLGLPDLLNTKTSRSGIGTFGLMDGAAIFSYNGLFPPEPSAWEKYCLQWVEPIVISNSLSNIPIPAVGLTTIQDTIYKIPISSNEYFLVENRNRDPLNNGQTLTIVKNNIDTVEHFASDTASFKYYNVSAINGSVVDVEDYDWSIIGEYDGTGKYDGGGILIWHIDENIITAGLSDNSVNANNIKGVKLEEADGSEDIGQSYKEFTAGYGTENGSPLDCWFNGNSAKLYENVFNNNTFPNSKSNSGATTFVTIKDFSLRSSRMTFSVDIKNNLLSKDISLQKIFASANHYPAYTNNRHIYIPANDSLYGFKSDGSNISVSSIIAETSNCKGIAVFDKSNSDIVVIAQDSSINVLHLKNPNINGIFDSVISYKKNIVQQFSTPPCFLDSANILIGTASGYVYCFDLFSDTIFTKKYSNSSINSIVVLPINTTTNESFVVSENKLFNQSGYIDLPFSSNEWIASGTVSSTQNFIVVAEKNSNKFLAFNTSLKKIFENVAYNNGIKNISIGDINTDGLKDIILQNDNSIMVYNSNGVLLDGFPIQLYEGKKYSGIPLIADFDGNNKNEIIAFTLQGEIYAYNNKGKILSGFPIQITSSDKNIFPIIYANSNDTLGIAALSTDGYFNSYLTNTNSTSSTVTWGQFLSNSKRQNSDLTLAIINPTQNEFLPKKKVYNWPNPVYGKSTQIRFYVSHDANVNVTIVDLAGVKITELNGRAIGGLDNEITWNVNNVQSGVYLARINAYNGNKNESVAIKIAVIK